MDRLPIALVSSVLGRAETIMWIGLSPTATAARSIAVIVNIVAQTSHRTAIRFQHDACHIEAGAPMPTVFTLRRKKHSARSRQAA